MRWRPRGDARPPGGYGDRMLDGLDDAAQPACQACGTVMTVRECAFRRRHCVARSGLEEVALFPDPPAIRSFEGGTRRRQ